MRELLGRKRDYPGLLDQIAEAYGKRIERAVRMGLYVRGRRVLHELEEVTGELAAVRALRALFIARATERMKQGESGGPAERLDALADALRIWPTLPGAEEQYVEGVRGRADARRRRHGRRLAAGPLGPLAGRRPRQSRLLYRPILATDDEEARQGKRPGQLAASDRDVRPGPSAGDPPPARGRRGPTAPGRSRPSTWPTP